MNELLLEIDSHQSASYPYLEFNYFGFAEDGRIYFREILFAELFSLSSLKF